MLNKIEKSVKERLDRYFHDKKPMYIIPDGVAHLCWEDGEKVVRQAGIHSAERVYGIYDVYVTKPHIETSSFGMPVRFRGLDKEMFVSYRVYYVKEIVDAEKYLLEETSMFSPLLQRETECDGEICVWLTSANMVKAKLETMTCQEAMDIIGKEIDISDERFMNEYRRLAYNNAGTTMNNVVFLISCIEEVEE